MRYLHDHIKFNKETNIVLNVPVLARPQESRETQTEGGREMISFYFLQTDPIVSFDFIHPEFSEFIAENNNGNIQEK